MVPQRPIWGCQAACTENEMLAKLLYTREHVSIHWWVNERLEHWLLANPLRQSGRVPSPPSKQRLWKGTVGDQCCEQRGTPVWRQGGLNFSPRSTNRLPQAFESIQHHAKSRGSHGGYKWSQSLLFISNCFYSFIELLLCARHCAGYKHGPGPLSMYNLVDEAGNKHFITFTIKYIFISFPMEWWLPGTEGRGNRKRLAKGLQTSIYKKTKVWGSKVYHGD